MERMISQCAWMLVQILEKKNSLIILARKIKVKIKMKKTVTANNQAQNSSHVNQKSKVKKKQYCHWKIFNFSLNFEGVYKMLCKC